MAVYPRPVAEGYTAWGTMAEEAETEEPLVEMAVMMAAKAVAARGVAWREVVAMVVREVGRKGVEALVERRAATGEEVA